MATSDANEIYISSSPHFAGKETTQGIMICVIISLLPICVYGVILYGIPALLTILVSVASCVLFEALFQVITKQKVTVLDFSAVLSGILLALVLPPTLPLWMTILGALFALVVAKAFFGGLGTNIFNPALTGLAFLFISFPAAMGATLVDPISSCGSIDVVSSATILSSLKNGNAVIDPSTYLEHFLGNRAGCIGESSILLILIAFVFLLVTKIIDWRAPVAMVGVVVLGTWVTGGNVLLSVLTGGLLFGAVFMVTDYTTSPVTKTGRLIFGAGCGLITFLIREFGGYPEGVMFSILIMNTLVPFLNKIVPRNYGYGKKVAKRGYK